MFFRKFVTALGLAAGLVSAPVYAANAVSQQIINPTGATSASDGIKIFIGSNSQVQVVGYSNLSVLPGPGIYPQMYRGCSSTNCSDYSTPMLWSLFNSVVLRIGPIGGGTARVIYANSDASSFASSSTRFEQTSQSQISGSGTVADPYKVVTTLNPPAPDNGITVVLTDTYVFPDPYFSRAIELTGLPADEQVKLYWYIDSFLAGDDNGYGTSRTALSNTTGIPDFVGVTKPGVLQGIQAAADMPLWDHYFSGFYTAPADAILSATGDLPDIIVPTNQDNGFAVQWNVPPGETSFATSSNQSYTRMAHVSRSYEPSLIMAGSNSTLTFEFDNRDETVIVSGAHVHYAVAAGISLASSTPFQNTCGTNVIIATASSDEIEFSDINLPAASSASSPYTCTISFGITSNVVGIHSGVVTTNHLISKIAPLAKSEALEVRGRNPPAGVSALSIPILNQWQTILLMAGLIGFGGLLARRRAERK